MEKRVEKGAKMAQKGAEGSQKGANGRPKCSQKSTFGKGREKVGKMVVRMSIPRSVLGAVFH